MYLQVDLRRCLSNAATLVYLLLNAKSWEAHITSQANIYSSLGLMSFLVNIKNHIITWSF